MSLLIRFIFLGFLSVSFRVNELLSCVSEEPQKCMMRPQYVHGIDC